MDDDHYAIDFPDPVEAIQFRMEQLGLNQQNLVPLIGSKSKVSEVLNKKRPDKINRKIKILSCYPGISSLLALQSL